MPMASPAVASSTDDVTIRSAINSAAAREDEDKEDGRLAPTRTVKQTSVLPGQGRWRGSSGRLRWHSLGPHGGGGLTEKENEANESRGADVSVMLSPFLSS